MAASRALAADWEQIEDSEILVTYDGAAGHINAALPPVEAGAAGINIEVGVGIEIRNNGDATLCLHEYGSCWSGRLVARMLPYSTLILRSTGDLIRPPWIKSDWLKETIAVAEDAHIADLAVTDIAVAGVTNNVNNADTWLNTAVSTSFDTQMDVAADELESEAATAFGEVETKVNAILVAMELAFIQLDA